MPDVSTIFADVRVSPTMTPESILDDIRGALEALRAADPMRVHEIEFPMKPERRCNREVMPAVSMPTDHPLVQTVARNVRAIVGVEPQVGAVVPRSYAGNDTAHLYGAGIPCFLCGPAAEYEEKTADRYTPVSQVIDCARVLAAALDEVCA